MGVLYKENFAQHRGGEFCNLKINLTEKNPKNSTGTSFSQKAKNFDFKPKKAKLNRKEKKLSFPNKIQPYKTKQKQKAKLFSSYFSFKIAFKPNKGQKSQVTSQDHHD